MANNTFIKLPFFLLLYLGIILILPLTLLFTQGFQGTVKEIICIATDPVAIHTYWITIKLALIACGFNTFFGLLLAWVLVRYDFRGRDFLDVCIDLPFALPTAVAGLTLSVVYGREGILAQFGEHIPMFVLSSETRVCLAMIFVSLPFVVRTIQPVLQSMNAEFEEVARILGASDWDVFETIVFPRVRPSLVAGASLGLSRSLGEYGSIVILSSNLPFEDLVTPVLIFQKLEQYDYRSASIIGLTILSLSMLILLCLTFSQSLQILFDSVNHFFKMIHSKIFFKM